VDRSVSWGTPHRNVNPDGWPPPSGFSYATVAADGTPVYLGGHTGHRRDGSIADDLVEQFEQAASNVAEVLRTAGAEPEHLVQLVIYVTDMDEYRRARREIGERYRARLGKHYPAMALIGVSELVDPAARVELVGVAVVPRA
jgi:enamine deaminase RidA (YjgF/YER057c/UK114 family)